MMPELTNTVVTVITMFRGYDAEIFTQVVAGELTEKQRDAWRKAHFCDQHCNVSEEEDGYNSMFFRAIRVQTPEAGTTHLINVNGEAQ